MLTAGKQYSHCVIRFVFVCRACSNVDANISIHSLFSFTELPEKVLQPRGGDGSSYETWDQPNKQEAE